MGVIKYVDHNTKSILYINLENAVSELEVLDLGEKAKKLVKLGSRNKIFVLYNLHGIIFTKKILENIPKMFEHSSLVERRVIFGIADKYVDLVNRLIQLFKLDRNTKIAQSYQEALDMLTDIRLWLPERRKVNIPVAEDKRLPPPSDTIFMKFDLDGLDSLE